jgi:hypothetical protein
MDAEEIRDLEAARLYVLQGLLIQRVSVPTRANVEAALTWGLELTASGHPLPPVGFLADLGQILLGHDSSIRSPRPAGATAAIDSGLARAYEDIVLGRLFTDHGLERAGHVIRRFGGRDQARAIAFVAERFCSAADSGGVLLSPAIFKGLIESGGNDVLSRAWQSASRGGISHTLKQQVTRLIAGCRHSAEVLTAEDIFELEHGSALADLGQRIAMRQVISMVRRLKTAVQRIGKPRVTQRDVATQLLDEDSYPVGGFVSIATRGSLESLLHSQLAYMEPPGSRRPDLFDIKFLRDELLYYSRDENQFLRHRHVFGFLFTKSLSQARFKDPTLPAQRIIMALGLVVAAIELLTEWLSEDALRFDLVFEATDSDDPLAQERAMLQSLLQESIASGTIQVKTVSDRSVIVRDYTALAERFQCRLLYVQTNNASVAEADLVSDYLTVSGPHPGTTLDGEKVFDDANDPAESWQTALTRLVSNWLQQ